MTSTKIHTSTASRLALVFALLPLFVLAQQAGREDFLRQQAYAEMQRVRGEMDAVQNGLDQLQTRVERLEGADDGASTLQSLRAEVDSLKSAIVELRRELANQRAEIVRDLSQRIAKLQPPAPPPVPTTREIVVSGPTSTYTVQSGDSLYLIAKAFHTTVSKIQSMNGLKNDRLSIGQKLIVPQVAD